MNACGNCHGWPKVADPMIEARCSACGAEWLVDEVIVDAAVGMAKFRGEYDGRLPSLGCPGCNGDTLEYVDD